MEVEKITILWSNRAATSLEHIYAYYYKISEKVAERIRKEILNSVASIKFLEQYQIDEVNPECRRLIVRHYKIIYKVKKSQLLILNIFDTRQHPLKSKL